MRVVNADVLSMKLRHMGYMDENEEVQEVIDRFAEECDGDLISRQAAIDIERNATVDTNPSHFEAHQKFVQFMDDAEISSFGRWQWSNGFNTALTAIRIDLKKLPSAEPERKTGKWIYKTTDAYIQRTCSACGWSERMYHRNRNQDGLIRNYCPNCGTKMEEQK